MSFISRKRKPKDGEEESKESARKVITSSIHEFGKLRLKSSYKVKVKKGN